MNSSVKYFARKIGTELVVAGAILGITAGIKFVAKSFFDRQAKKEIKELMRDE